MKRDSTASLKLTAGSNGRQLPTATTEWLRYFSANADSLREIPWHLGADAPNEEVERIVPSLQAWQLGETSDGSHLFQSATAYAEKMGDPLFPRAVRLFIKEEQRHGDMLGRFLDLSGFPRIKRNWGDSAFRAIRYSFRNMEVWATPVVMIETMALIYYRALHDATQSRVLKAICRQILHDEIPHIRFQYERLAILHRGRSRFARLFVAGMHRSLFLAIVLAVWAGHSAALKAGGHSFFSYWSCTWKRMNRAWQGMNPDRYDWGGQEVKRAYTAISSLKVSGDVRLQTRR